jgi:hypothetical protein
MKHALGFARTRPRNNVRRRALNGPSLRKRTDNIMNDASTQLTDTYALPDSQRTAEQLLDFQCTTRRRMHDATDVHVTCQR